MPTPSASSRWSPGFNRPHFRDPDDVRWAVFSGVFGVIPALRRSRFPRLLLVATALIVAGLVGACTTIPGGPVDGLGCENPPVAKGPYALGMTPNGITIRWDSEREGCAEVTLLNGSGIVVDRLRGTVQPHDIRTVAGVEPGKELERIPDLPGRVFLHEVKFTGLEPGTCYGYRITGEIPVASHRFCTARLPGERVRFAVIGDTQVFSGVMADLIPAIAKEQPDFIVHTGDMQYYMGPLETWASWAPAMQGLFSTAAVLPAVGNHEHERKYEYEDYYSRFFRKPGKGTTEWYTYSTAGVHFFALDSESPVGPGTKQDQWLRGALEAAKAQDDYRFAVFVFHRPIYTLSNYEPRMSIRTWLEPLFEPYDVRLVMVGHAHLYERFEIGRVISLTTGGGGAVLYSPNLRNDEFPEDAARLRKAVMAHHFVLLEVDEETISGRAINRQGEVIDSFEVPVK